MEDFSKPIPDLDYSEFKQLMCFSLPLKESNNSIAFIEDSLVIDFLYLVYELHRDDLLALDQKSQKLLGSKLKLSTENYGLSVFNLGLWEPLDSDESKWIRNIKILISSKESLTDEKYSTSDLRDLKLDPQ